MLLTVIDLIESGDIQNGWVKYDVPLVSRFRDYWELVLERQRNAPDIPMPFHALGGDKDMIWERFTADCQPSFAKATTRLCSLDPDFFACLEDAGFRRKARETLVNTGTRWREVGDGERHRGEGVRACRQVALAERKRVELMEKHGGLLHVASFQRRMFRES